MPNWKPSEEHIDRFKQATNLLLQRRVSACEADFPLTPRDVEIVTTPPELAQLVALGLDSMQTTHTIMFEMTKEHGVERRSVVAVHLAEPRFYAYRSQLNHNLNKEMPIYFHDGLDRETHARLVKWVNRAVYEHRLAKLTSMVVADFFNHVPNITMYHIAARWPVLKVIFPLCKEAYWNGRGADIWERHGNELAANLNRWGWPYYGDEYTWRRNNTKKMQVAEEAILSCLTLPLTKEDQPRHRFYATIADWEVFEGWTL